MILTSFSLLLSSEKAIVVFTSIIVFTGAYEIQGVVRSPYHQAITVINTNISVSTETDNF
jgi:hypothetical protein